MNKQTKNYKKLAGVASVALCSVALATGFLTHTGVNTGQTVLAEEQQTDDSVKNISTAQQLYDALNDTSVTQINIENDIDMSSLGNQPGNTADTPTIQRTKPLLIKKADQVTENPQIDFGKLSFNYNFSSSEDNTQSQIVISNIKMQGENYFGPVNNRSTDGGITFDNITYQGPQLTYSTSSTVYIKNNVQVASGKQYKEGIIDRQENIEAKNIEFLEGSQYTGTGNGVLFNLSSGKITLDENAKVSLIPNAGNTNQPIIGISADINNGGILLNSGSNLTINPQTVVTTSYPISMNSASLNINAPESGISTPLLSVGSNKIAINNGSSLNVNGNRNADISLVTGITSSNLSLSGDNSSFKVTTNHPGSYTTSPATDLTGFKNNSYAWSMKKGSDSQETITDPNNYDETVTDLTITPKPKSVTVSSDNLSLSKEGNSFNINFDLDAQNVSPKDTTSVSVMINGNAHSSQTVSANQGNNRLSLGDGYTPKVNDQITVVSDFGLERSSQTYTVTRDDVRSFYKPTLSINNDLTLSRSGDTISTGFVLNTENTDDQDKANVTVSVQKHNSDTSNSQQDKLDQTSKLNQPLSLKLDPNYTPEVDDVITVSAALDGVNGSAVTKAKKLTQADVDALKKLEGSTPSFQSGLVNYVKGYGVLLWQLTANGLEPTTQYQAANSYVPYYGDYQIIDGIKYLHIANQNTWIQSQYLQDPTQLPEIPMNNTAVAGNVPYGIYLRDGSGNMTEQIIEPGTSWQVFAKKTFHGHTYYRLGNDQQWLEDTYIQSMN
ncbi:pectate lyase-like adhesive domain-containing protein [Holzapfeliella sp. He02]|uniref:Pectate lyase-like adhesive domain-containing protein n=1 Tax=Holzapfeliella saturejae TaxID=3082953 RepID=A0ABU8SEG4_9LACO